MMKKQLQKFKLGVENLSRPNKPDKNSEELLVAEHQVENYKFVFDKIVKKCLPAGTLAVGGILPSSGGSNNTATSGIGQVLGANGADNSMDHVLREKRYKKLYEYRLAQAMTESAEMLSDGLLHDVLLYCAHLERNIARDIVDNELKVEKSVTCKLTEIMEKQLTTIQKQKRIVTKLMQDKETAKYKHQAAVRVNENITKIIQLKDEQEECENRLEKERDIWASEMFELIAEERSIANYIVNYVTAQRLYYKSALEQIEEVMTSVDGLISNGNRRIFNIALDEHLQATNRKIAYVIEMCVCCLLERGMNEEGLLRVGCAGSKLRRFRSAIDANKAQMPLPPEYFDVHVIASILKLYLRNLPDPLLTFRLYDEFVAAARCPNDDQCKKAIRQTIKQLPNGNYDNLRYLTKFLSLLSANSDQNKMSSHNIAIVMAPNLLWSAHVDNDKTGNDMTLDYLDRVNSSTLINRLLEMLVSDWDYFFDGSVEFFQTLRRDSLFQNTASALVTEPGASAIEISDPLNLCMTNSMNENSTIKPNSRENSTHSRSNSHDTSRILMSPLHGEFQMDASKRSQSSSSLSDASSPPGQNSPKLPARRKHNKQAAPTPPDIRSHKLENKQASGYQDEDDKLKTDQRVDSKDGLSVRNPYPSNVNNDLKPDKPPRPIFAPLECHTLNRAQYRSAKESTSSSVHRPSALPRGMLFTNRSTENLSDNTAMKSIIRADGQTSPITIRESNNASNTKMHPVSGKPVIPDRPISLRPHSFKAPIGYTASSSGNSGVADQMNAITGEHLNRTESFRAKNILSNKDQTTLARTHIYNVDKKQVSIIDFDNSEKIHKMPDSTIAGSGTVPAIIKTNTPAKLCLPTAGDTARKSEFSLTESTNSTHTTQLPAATISVPASPRGFDPKIKRPQIPAPPPPIGGKSTIRSKLETADSTNL